MPNEELNWKGMDGGLTIPGSHPGRGNLASLGRCNLTSSARLWKNAKNLDRLKRRVIQILLHICSQYGRPHTYFGHLLCLENALIHRRSSPSFVNSARVRGLPLVSRIYLYLHWWAYSTRTKPPSAHKHQLSWRNHKPTVETGSISLESEQKALFRREHDSRLALRSYWTT